MAHLENHFTFRLGALLQESGYSPELNESGRRAYFGEDRIRQFLHVDYWARLSGLTSKPTLLVELDTSPSDLGHNVAKYLWWASQADPFWTTPALLISAFTETRARNYALHQAVAVYLGSLLAERVPGTTHRVVDLRGEPVDLTENAKAEELAERAAAMVTQEFGLPGSAFPPSGAS